MPRAPEGRHALPSICLLHGESRLERIFSNHNLWIYQNITWARPSSKHLPQECCSHPGWRPPFWFAGHHQIWACRGDSQVQSPSCVWYFLVVRATGSGYGLLKHPLCPRAQPQTAAGRQIPTPTVAARRMCWATCTSTWSSYEARSVTSGDGQIQDKADQRQRSWKQLSDCKKMIELFFLLVSTALRSSQRATAAVFNDELLPVLVNNQQLVCNIKPNIFTEKWLKNAPVKNGFTASFQGGFQFELDT